jgi:aminoglycoside 3-N-acetyltransferase I
MPTTIGYRRLEPADREPARVLFTLLTEVFGEQPPEYGDEWLDRLLADPALLLYAAFRDGELVGGLTAHRLPMTRSATSEVLVYDLAVRADQRRLGLAGGLLAALRAEAGCPVFVLADDADREARSFYAAVGGAAEPVTLYLFDA